MSQTLPLLSLVIFSPLVGAIILGMLPQGGDSIKSNAQARAGAMISSLITFILSLVILQNFSYTDSGMQLEESAVWIKSFGVHYALGIDGISLWLVLLTTLLMPIIILASHSVETKLKGYLCNMLVLESAILGSLLALDMFLFYIFWELMLFPMYFIIGIWGGKRRIYATLKFVLYTVIGSLLMLIAMFYLVWNNFAQSGEISFLLSDLMGSKLILIEELWLFGAFALAFAIKVPIWPFHTWLPDAHVEAPTGGSVILAGVLLKMGLYGFIRFAYPLFPRAADEFAPLLATLAVIGIVYGALVAWAQKDIKKLVAYSSVSHLGYCVLGWVALNTMSTTGSIFQMLSHGISTGALFLLVGVLYDRRHTREISEYGGLTSKVPIFAFLFLVFTLSSIALPLTNGFIGEFMILAGSFQVFPRLTIVAVSGVVLGAIYMLTLYMKTMFGELDESKNGDLTDVNTREILCFLPLIFLVFYMGLAPNHFTKAIEPTIKVYLENLENRKKNLSAEELHRAQDVAGVMGASSLMDKKSVKPITIEGV